MDAETLRAIQAPLKQHYRDNPAQALVPARAEALIDQEHLTCRLSGPRHEYSGLHPAAGGPAGQACSADMLLESLVACAGVTLAAVATSMGVVLRHGRVVADSSWDARGTLAIDRAVPIGLGPISLCFELDTDADAATLARLLKSTERYCVIFQTLAAAPTCTARAVKHPQ
ncbi:OsmC family protein [Acidocella sp.]|uniref:OsmC family protein n=1 Tax=Acidocella sp. TaxID=50710 RepID=UPI003D0184E4